MFKKYNKPSFENAYLVKNTKRPKVKAAKWQTFPQSGRTDHNIASWAQIMAKMF